MVQIQAAEGVKPREVGEQLLPGPGPGPRLRPASSRSCIFLVLLSVIFAVLTVKTICDLKEENLRLWQQLALERQKDSALKLAVRDNIPSTRFLAHQFTAAEVALVQAEGLPDPTPGSSWTINLSVLWSAPDITPCDMHLLSHVLAEEIYSKGAAEREALSEARPWREKEEQEQEEVLQAMEEEEEVQEALGNLEEVLQVMQEEEEEEEGDYYHDEAYPEEEPYNRDETYPDDNIFGEPQTYPDDYYGDWEDPTDPEYYAQLQEGSDASEEADPAPWAEAEDYSYE